MPTRPRTFRPNNGVKAGLIERISKKERDAFYTGKTWRRLREQFLIDNPLCVDCLNGDILTQATIAHHEEERLSRPDLSLDTANLTALCNACHTRRHNPKAP